MPTVAVIYSIVSTILPVGGLFLVSTYQEENVRKLICVLMFQIEASKFHSFILLCLLF